MADLLGMRTHHPVPPLFLRFDDQRECLCLSIGNGRGSQISNFGTHPIWGDNLIEYEALLRYDRMVGYMLAKFAGPQVVRSIDQRARKILPEGLMVSKQALAFLEKKRMLVRDCTMYHVAVDDLSVADDVGPDIRRGMFDHQVIGISFMNKVRRMLLADAIGLGKTAQTIRALDQIGAKRILVVAPKSLIVQWRSQINQWSVGDTASDVLTSASSQPQIPSCRWVVSTYEQMVRRSQQLIQARFDGVVADEAVRLKNRKAARTREFYSISRKAATVYLLTGTPMRSRPSEMWSLLHILRPDLFTSYWSYARYFLTEITDAYASTYTRLKLHREDEFHEMLSTIMLRREKSLLNLPALTVEDVPLEMTRKAAAAYNSILKDMVVPTDHGDVLITPNILAQMTRMRQIACSPSLIGIDDGRSAKLEWLDDFLSDHQTEKVLIFTTFAAMARKIVAIIQASGLNVQTISGDVSSTLARDKAVNEFQTNPDCRYLVSTEAGGEGLNLQSADIVVLINFPWTPDQVEQWIGRAWRQGRNTPIHVYRLLCVNTIDEDMRNVLSSKEEVISRTLNVKAVVEATIRRHGLMTVPVSRAEAGEKEVEASVYHTE